MQRIFAFFGYPGAGKSTLSARFAALHGITGIDTDCFMTEEEIAAVTLGRYTEAMRLANIVRYCTVIRERHPDEALALADGLPTDASRRLLLAQFAPGTVMLVLVETEPAIRVGWLATRSGNPVEIDLAAADAYVAAHWKSVATDLPVRRIANSNDPEVVDAQLRALYLAAAPSPGDWRARR